MRSGGAPLCNGTSCPPLRRQPPQRRQEPVGRGENSLDEHHCVACSGMRWEWPWGGARLLDHGGGGLGGDRFFLTSKSPSPAPPLTVPRSPPSPAVVESEAFGDALGAPAVDVVATLAAG